jgi:hypothetical protein
MLVGEERGRERKDGYRTGRGGGGRRRAAAAASVGERVRAGACALCARCTGGLGVWGGQAHDWVRPLRRRSRPSKVGRPPDVWPMLPNSCGPSRLRITETIPCRSVQPAAAWPTKTLLLRDAFECEQVLQECDGV